MGQICDCLFRIHQHNSRLIEIEDKTLKYEHFMEQWLVNNSCCTLYKQRRDDCKVFK